MVLSSRRVCVHARCRGQTYLGRAAPSTLGDAKPVHDAEFEQLITAFPPDSYASRARSASDAGVLRRKGRLKEQDQVATPSRGHSASEGTRTASKQQFYKYITLIFYFGESNSAPRNGGSQA